MRFRLLTIALLAVPLTVVRPPGAVAQQKEQPKARKAPPEKKAKPASLTGCIDQQEGQYVLIHDRTRDLLANLEAEGFPTEGFARYLGHKVTVRGVSGPNDTPRPTFKVRTVESVSDSCAPQER